MSEAKKFTDCAVATDVGTLLTVDGAGNVRRVSLDTLLGSIHVGGRNLLKGSNVVKSNKDYTTAIYEITDTLEHNERIVVTIWGDLGEQGTRFKAYNSGGSVEIGNLAKIKDGVFQFIGNWKVGDTTNDRLWIFSDPYSKTANVTINHIKLERGGVGTFWTPAPEDLLSNSGG